MTDPVSQTHRRHPEVPALRRGPWAVNEADSGGRKFPEPPHPWRTCFQRDRDRVVHCSAFRRLDFKTQVFVPHEHDHFRTRLTHTLEVAQIARDLARALGCNEDLAEAVALAHDLGHPPFGHGGEKVLDELMVDHGRFEHNRQSLRIVDYLEHPYPGFRGLNLTEAVRECLARHETKFDAPICDSFPPGLLAPLEGQLVDLADEIAWTAADLEDALGSGMLAVEQLGGLALWQQAWATTEADYPGAGEIHKRIRATKAVLAIMADDVLAATSKALAETNLASADDVRRAGRRIANLSTSLRSDVDLFQEFLLTNVYLVAASAEQASRAEKVILELFNAYVSDPSLLPHRYGQRIDQSEGDSVHRVACDYIAGMTDRFCRQEHQRMFGNIRAERPA